MATMERASLASVFERTLAELSTSYEPVVRWSERRVVGHQVRVHAAAGARIDLAGAARRLGRAHDLGRAVRRRVGEAPPPGPVGGLVLLKLDAEELNDNELLSSSATLAPLAGRVVLEIGAREGLAQVSGLATRLARLRNAGYGIALDELGAGWAGLTSLGVIEPELVKLDPALTRAVHRSPRQATLVAGLARTLSRDLSILVVCEGVDGAEQRDALARQGLDLMQGRCVAE
jgi:EAL domain-containing protein (putative c-di-GMP-specific phosphodiesterase class I)